MILKEIVDILTEKVQIGLSEDAMVWLRIDDELHEQHKQQIERLEMAPPYLRTDRPWELEETVCDADAAVGHRCGAAARVKIDTHLWKYLNLV